jgi:hypothetical protein
MTATFDKLKALLDKNNALTPDEITAALTADGEMTEAERIELEAERHKKQRTNGKQITMDEYLAASKVLDSAAEDSAEYKAAEAIVTAYESGG